MLGGNGSRKPVSDAAVIDLRRNLFGDMVRRLLS